MNWKVFIVFHKHLFFEHYEKDEQFSESNYTFCKIDKLENNYTHLSNIIDINNFPNFVQLESQYNEYQAIYNIFKNKDVYKDLDYIGFSQYDKPHQFRHLLGHNVTEKIIENLNLETHISLESYDFRTDFNQRIMMDESRTEELTGNGRNCYYGIIEDYNSFHDTNHSIDELWNKKINLVSSFILPVKYFDKVMKFISFIIESGKINQFDKQRRFRLQAGLLERYMGVAILFENIQSIDLTTEHFNQK